MGFWPAPLGTLLDLLRPIPDRRRFRGPRQSRHPSNLRRERGVLALRPAVRAVGHLHPPTWRALRRVVAR